MSLQQQFQETYDEWLGQQFDSAMETVNAGIRAGQLEMIRDGQLAGIRIGPMSEPAMGHIATRLDREKIPFRPIYSGGENSWELEVIPKVTVSLSEPVIEMIHSARSLPSSIDSFKSNATIIALRLDGAFVHRARIVKWFQSSKIPYTVGEYQIEFHLDDFASLLPSVLEAELIKYSVEIGFRFDIRCKDDEETNRVAALLKPKFLTKRFKKYYPDLYQGVRITIPY